MRLGMHGLRMNQCMCTRVCGTPAFVHVVIRWLSFCTLWFNVSLWVLLRKSMCQVPEQEQCQAGQASVSIVLQPTMLTDCLQFGNQNMARQKSEVPKMVERKALQQIIFYSLWADLVPKRRAPLDKSKETLKQFKKQTCNVWHLV